jgi:hypothetical protein
MYKYLLFLVLVFLLSCSPLKKYEYLPEVLAWESDIQKFEQLDKSVNYSKDAILFAGSSSIRLWTTIEKDIAPYNVIQRGYGGAKLSDFAVYAHRIFDPHPCKAIVLFIANDIVGNEQDKSPGEVEKLFRYVLKTIRKTHPDTPVFWIAVTPTPSRWKAWPRIKEAGRLIEEVCNTNKNVYYIKTEFAFLNETGAPKDELFISDKLHLNENGYAVWTEIIKKELNNVFKR